MHILIHLQGNGLPNTIMPRSTQGGLSWRHAGTQTCPGINPLLTTGGRLLAGRQTKETIACCGGRSKLHLKYMSLHVLNTYLNIHLPPFPPTFFLGQERWEKRQVPLSLPERHHIWPCFAPCFVSDKHRSRMLGMLISLFW